MTKHISYEDFTLRRKNGKEEKTKKMEMDKDNELNGVFPIKKEQEEEEEKRKRQRGTGRSNDDIPYKAQRRRS